MPVGGTFISWCTKGYIFFGCFHKFHVKDDDLNKEKIIDRIYGWVLKIMSQTLMSFKWEKFIFI